MKNPPNLVILINNPNPKSLNFVGKISSVQEICKLNAVIKRLPTNYRSALVDIANASMKLAHVPTDWKEATIRMLLKPLKERLKDDSYRPISLLNTLSKLLEGVILNRIKSWSEKNNLLSKYGGFRNFRKPP